MKQVLWRVPLSITRQNGMSHRFCGPYDTLDFLEHEWPSQGKRQRRAIGDCRAAPSYAGGNGVQGGRAIQAKA
ncbi:DUF982 domain-containing protein [Sinorhizobium meliloti]|nr:DUF982 domain-containing protein [Sinorhizobium meliloti]